MVFGARSFGTRGFGDNTGDVGVTVPLSDVIWNVAASHIIEGDTTVSLYTVHGVSAAHTISGEFDTSAAFIIYLKASHEISGEFAVAIPPVEGAMRVVLVGASGSTLGVLENAVVGPVTYRLNEWETWSFVLPVTDPKSHLILEQYIREAQIWKGDMLLSWGPMVRPTVDDNHVAVEGNGARWHLSRRHVGKASRDDQLCNGGFEQGLTCWNFLKSEYFLTFAPLEDGDVRVYMPGLDGERALEINMDLKPWTSPTGGSGATVTKVHVVVPGDTLWDLARTYYGSGTQWYRIYNENQALIQSGAVAAGLWNPYDPGHWIFPGQSLTIPGIATTEVVTAPPDDGTLWGDTFAFQEFLVNGGVRGLTATLSAWVYVRSDLLEGWGVHRRGVGLERFRPDYRTNNMWDPVDNTWGGYRGLYTEVIEETSSRLGEEHPLDTWVRHETSITVPPGTTEILHARLSGVEGRVYWDRARLTYDTAFEAFDIDQTAIVAQLVAHAQDPAFDKNDVNIDTEAAPTGVNRTLVALHSEHGNIWDLISEPTKFQKGFDIGMRYTPTNRILTTHYPKKGVTQRRLHLQPHRNISSFSWTFDGEAASSSVIVLGTGDGSDREEASAINTAAFSEDLILETVYAVGPDTPVDMLQEIADEHLNVVSNPELLTVTTFPHDPTLPERNFIGRMWEGDIIPVTIRKSYVDADMSKLLQFEIDDDYRVIELTINPDDSLSLTLNRRVVV
jgi:hypothetical protein